MRKQFYRSTLSALMFSVAACWAAAATADDFYKGKTIRLIVATTPGGGFDAYSRMLTRHMGKHVPGNPTFVVENMPGAAFLTQCVFGFTDDGVSPFAISAMRCSRIL